MKIAVFIAHPDYSVMNIGGTLIKHAQRGDDVHVITMCPGELGIGTVVYPTKSREELVAIRTRELEAAALVQGVKEVRVLRFEDTKLINTPDLQMVIAKILREIRPDILITHWPQDAHPDLRGVGQAAVDACLLSVLGYLKTEHEPHEVKKVYTFGIKTTIDFQPDIFIDITEVMNQKLKAIECLDSVVQEVLTLRGSVDGAAQWKEWIFGPAMYWGQESGTRYAEAFKEVKQPEGKRAIQALPL